MKILNNFIKYFLGMALTLNISCTPVAPVPIEFGVDIPSIQLGVEQEGKFVQKTDKTFSVSEKIILKVKAKGLAIIQGKIKVNIDLFLKKDKDILGTENDILGKDGLNKPVPGVDSTYSGNNGEADLEIGIIPPSETTGELAANITLKDLNSSGKLVSFQTTFIINQIK